MFKTAIKILILLVVAAYLVFALTTLNRRSKPRQCEGLDITLEDTGFVNENDVRQLLVRNKLFPEGQPMDNISLARMESCLVASPHIAEALCYQTVDGKVAINITPLRPILHVINNEGQDFYIADNATTMPRADHTADLIVLTGNVPRKTAAKLYTELGLRLTDDPYWNREVAEIHVTQRGELQLMPRQGHHTIILGDTSALDDKLRRLRLFYEEGLNKVGWNRYKTISLKFDNQIVCTKWE